MSVVPKSTPRSSESFGQQRKGAIVLAGAHGSLAIARGLARHGYMVWFLTENRAVPCFSRAIKQWRYWPGADHPDGLAFIEDLVSTHQLEGYFLIPSTDADVKFVGQNHERLSQILMPLGVPWARLEWAVNKSRYAARAEELGLDVPLTYQFNSPADAVARADRLKYPVIIKPAMRLDVNALVRDKAWQADNAEQFVRLFEKAFALCGAHGVMVQEFIPGGGETQLSYAALWWQGKPLSQLVARRLRQYPIRFGIATIVDTVDDEDVIDAGERFLASISHHGLCEIEFKRDLRTGQLRLIDVNPRPFTWLGLVDAAGVDWGAMLDAAAHGREVPEMTARPGVAWLFFVRDCVGVLQALMAGRFDFGDYVRSLFRVRTFSTFAWNDPMPAVMELPLVGWRAVRRYMPGSAAKRR